MVHYIHLLMNTYKKMSNKYIFVFDIETIPDTEAVYNLLGIKKDTELSFDELNTKLIDYHLKITDGKNDFLRQPFHKIVVISYLYAQIDYVAGCERYQLKGLRSAGSLPYTQHSEKELITGFFDMINKYQPKLISFNGRMFDLPVLKYRAMKYGISGNYYYSSDSPFKSYDYRYNLDKHCDLIEALSDFGASAKIKLNEVCSIFGFPGKFGTDGSDVLNLFTNNKIQEIRDYCETDVLNTYLVYLRYALHTNIINLDSYNFAIQDILHHINQNNTDTLNLFKQAWLESHNNTLNLTEKQNVDNFLPTIK